MCARTRAQLRGITGYHSTESPPNQGRSQRGNRQGKCPPNFTLPSRMISVGYYFNKILCISCLNTLLCPPNFFAPPNFFFPPNSVLATCLPKWTPKNQFFKRLNVRCQFFLYQHILSSDKYFDGVGHFPDSTAQGICKVWRKNTRIMCIKCSKRLHRSNATM